MNEILAVIYIRSNGLRTAYQCFGTGATTVVLPALVTNLEVLWEHEYYRRVFLYCSSYREYVRSVLLPADSETIYHAGIGRCRRSPS